jgi:hypothetical protein
LSSDELLELAKKTQEDTLKKANQIIEELEKDEELKSSQLKFNSFIYNDF